MSPVSGVLSIMAPTQPTPQSPVSTVGSSTVAAQSSSMARPTMSAATAKSGGADDKPTCDNSSGTSTTTDSKETSSAIATGDSADTPSASTTSKCGSSASSTNSSQDLGSTANSKASTSQENSRSQISSLNYIDTESKTVRNAIISTNGYDRPQKVQLNSINAHITCNLCKGYLIDATTIVECLHSFCHSCIIQHFRTKQYCPECEMMINTAKPNIKPDTTLQAIVYKLVPGLYQKELLRKRAFYRDRPKDAASATPEQRGEDTEHLIFSPTENLSLSLEYADFDDLPESESLGRKYLQCPANCTVSALKKFITFKFGIDTTYFNVEIMYKVKTIVLSDHYTLMDVAYIYTWKRDVPMRFFFRVKELENAPPRRIRNCSKKVSKIPETETSSSKKIDEQISETKLESTEKVDIKIEIKEEKEMPILFPEFPISPPLPETAVVMVPVPVVQEITAAKDVKREQPVPSSSSEPKPEPKTEKLKITLVNKGKTAKVFSSSGNDDPPAKSKSDSGSAKPHKSAKGPKHHHSHHNSSSHQKQPTPDRDERKVENIKLKIDLSKQNSVTIINMSGPESGIKKEVVKPVKPEKEWKLKIKKDKEDKNNGGKTQNGSESSKKNKIDSHQRFEIKNSPDSQPGQLVPPLTLTAEKRSPKREEVVKEKPDSPKKAEEKNEEEKKSEFLNSIALLPIKFAAPSPEKADKSKPVPITVPPKPPVLSIPTPPPPMVLPQKNSSTSKRKNKEPVKAIIRKPKIESPNNTSSPTSPKEQQSISFKLSPFPINVATNVATTNPADFSKKQADEKLMPAPPPLKMFDVSKKNGVKLPKASKAKQNTGTGKLKTNLMNNNMQRPPGSGTPRSYVPLGIASSKIPIVPNVPGNRTPIARRYAPILPKSPRPNPFANIPVEVNNFLNSSGTEIKQISNDNKDLKVYGPAMPILSNKALMGPPTLPVHHNTLPNPRNSTKNQNNTKYHQFALLNASKSKMSEVPLGCRTPIYAPNSPIYTPNSPIYSPNSPQYLPNYNIPTQPTYKYTKPQSVVSNFLQNVLGQNKQLSNLFPAPPTKKPPEGPNNKISSPPEGELKKLSNDENSLKRPYPFASSPPSADKILEPPEKQMKVQNLLNSCKINIPSSLSITITNEELDSASSNSANPKHKSPVNNYIEILKLPDSQPAGNEQKSNSPPSEQKMNQINQSTIQQQQHSKPNDTKVSMTCSVVTIGSNTKPIMTVHLPKSNPSVVNSSQCANPLSSPTNGNGNNGIDNSNQPPPLNLIEKKPQQEKSSTPKNKKTTSPGKKEANAAKNAEKKKLLQNLLERKSPPEKKETTVSPSNNKTPKDNDNSAPPAKKFRPILPRTEAPPTKDAKKKSDSPAAMPNIPNTKILPKAPTKAQQQKLLNKKSATSSPPSGSGGGGPPTKYNKNDSKSKATDATVLDLTASPSGNSVPHPSTPPVKSMPTTSQQQQLSKPSNSPLQSPVPGQSLNQPQQPDITSLLNDTILRAQQNGMFLPHLAAAASFNPHYASVNLGYNLQQAYLVEQFTRMQKAGHDALEKFIQKYKGSGKTSPNGPTNSSASASGAGGNSKDLKDNV